MKSNLTFSRWLISILLISFWGIGSVMGQDVGKYPDPNDKAAMAEEMEIFLHQSDRFLDQSTSSRVSGCATTLDEGFEGDTWPPAGWTVISGGDANTWNWFTGSPHTGTYMAGIQYGSTAHNDWLVTPKIQPEVGNAELSFWAANYSDSYPEQFNVKLSTTGTNQTDFTVTLASNVTPPMDYTQYTYDLTAYIGQPVYVAVQAISADQYYLFLDDFLGPNLVYPATPYFNGGNYLSFGTTYDAGVYELEYDISNCSTTADLVVSLDAADPALAISGLPATIPAGGSATVTVTFTPSATGPYAGDFTLTTNDPDNLLVTVDVASTVLETVVSPVLFEDFNAVASFGIPANWTGNFSVRTSGGVDNSNRFTRNLWGTGSSKVGQFTTNFIELPLNSKFKLDYRAVNYTAYPATPTPAANFAFEVYLSTDYGVTFIPIYTYDPLTHIASLDYTNVEVDLAAYIGETVMFAVAAERFDGDFYLDFDNFGVQSAEPGVGIVNAMLDMGARPIGAWMKPAAFEIINNPGAGDFEITAADIDNNAGGFLQVVAPALPYALASGETTFEFGVTNGEAVVADGPFSGSFAMFYGPARAVLTADYTGNAYTPVAGDVWEMAFDANTVTFPDNVAMGSFVDNYDLPGATDDGWDAVYKLNVNAGDVVADITLVGTNAKMAIYPADFGGIGGPDMDNALVYATTSATGLELFEGVYYLVVSTTGADYTLTYTPTTMLAPVAVSNISPLDGAVDIENGEMLTWSWGANTLDYRVVLGTTYPPATVVQDWGVANTATNGSYTLAGLNPNLQYFWRVDVRNNNGTTNGDVWGFTTTISSVSGLTATVNDAGESSTTVSALLEWDNPMGRAFIGYNVYRNLVKITPTPVAGESFTDLGLARNTTYSYYVTAVFDEGESAPSNTVEITTLGVGNVAGFVYDALNNEPLEGASVRIQGANGTYALVTDETGAYASQVYAGLYNYTVSATDFDNQTLSGQTVLHGGTLTNNFYLSESPYPVADVVAFELDEDKVQVSWGGSTPPPPPPLIEEWLAYDDNGIPTQYWWAGAGAPFSWAISFDPADLEDLAGASLTKVAIFNTSAPDVNTLTIYEGDLSAGTATVVHTQALTGLTLEDWNEVDLTVPVPIDITKQLWVSMYSPSPTGGVAASTPGLNMKGDWVNFSGSWIHMSTGTGNNVTWSLRAFATNASNRSVTQLVSKYTEPRYNTVASAALESISVVGAKPFRPEYSSRGIADYTVWREKVYQAGALEEIGNTSQLDFVDFDWGTMDWGVYRWAVTANYDGGQTSIPTFSNVLDKDMEVVVDGTVTLNSNEEPGGTSVTFTNMSEPDLELVYNEVLGNAGTFTWNEFRRGVYDIEVVLPGYAVVTETGVDIFDDTSFTWLLEELLASPSDLYVTPTAFATWNLGGGGGSFVPFMESFDGLAFGELPEGWTKSPETTNWGASTSANAGGTAPEMRFNWSPSGTNAFYLMTPMMSTEGQSSLQLTFKQYINDYNSDYTMSVIAIADGVEYIIEEWLDPSLLPDITPMVMTYALTAAHGVGAADFQIAWVFDGNSFNINQWYIDDFMLNGARANSNRSFEASKVFLDGQLVAETTDRSYQFDVETLTAYETYTAGVAAVYSTGQSPTVERDFIYVPCGDYATPTAFAVAQVDGTLNTMLEWTNVDAAALDTISALRIYRNGEEYAEVDFTDVASEMFLDTDLDIGSYTYCLTYIYDSGAETCLASICESVDVTGGGFVSGNVSQAAYLGGDAIQGAALTLTSTTDSNISFTFITDAAGDYEGEVLGNQIYDYTVEATGYVTELLPGVEVLMSETVVQNFLMMEFPAPVELVTAEEISDGQVKVSWRSPGTILFEPYMEDFTDGLSGWTPSAGNWATNASANAGGVSPELRFNWSPSGTGDYSIISPVLPYASSNNALYLSFKHMVNDFSGGYNLKVITVADGVTHVVQQWTPTASIPANTFEAVITAEHGLGADEFQIGFMFSGETFDINYWYIDDVVVTNTRARNLSRDIPESTLAGYNVYRTSCDDGGDMQFLGYTLDSTFNDNTWGAAASGVYKWAVEAVYAENESEARFSNCLDKDMYTTVSVSVSTNSGDSPEGTDVWFMSVGTDLEYEVELDESGYFMWDNFRKGVYDIYVGKNGFEPIGVVNALIDGPTDFVWILEEQLSPVSDLFVTPTGFATWRPGGIIPFEPYAADFEADEMGWEIQGNVNGWQWGNTGSLSSSFVNFQGNSTNFIAVNADAAGSGGTPIVALTKSPMLDLSTADEVYVSFDYRLINDDLSIHYSIGGGDPILLEQLATNTAWATNHMVALPEEALESDVQIIFLYEEGSTWGYGAGVDNVIVTDEPMGRELQYYKVWLDGVFVEDVMENFYQYDVTTLVEGQEYYSEVAAVYSNGMSDKMDYTWTYYSCENYPGPENLAGSVSGQNVTLTWGAAAPPPPPPGDGFSDDFEGYADFVIDFAPWTNVDVDGSTTYGMTGITWPNAYAAQSFIVYNPSTTTPPLADVVAHSGNKFAACFAAVTAPNNDWLISPQVPVEAGTNVNFWAKSYVADYGLERFKVGVSTTGTAPADFTIITPGSFVEAPATAWTEFTYDLSAYAGQNVYVGIQCVSNDAFFLMIDDFTVGAPAASYAFNNEAPVTGQGTKAIGEPVIVRHDNVEIDANADARTVQASREMWDLVFSFDVDTPSGLTGLAGAETDGEFIYAAKWAGSEIAKFDVDGNYIETFSIPGVSGLRDLAFDGTYMYGAAAATTVYKMDFTNKTLVSSFTAPVAVRAIAYDDDLNAFWGNNWDANMVLFTEAGATLNTLSGMPSMYGAAYDNFSEGGPYLWFFTGTTTGGGAQVEQYDIAGGALTGVTHSVSAALGDYIAGGLFISEDLVEGKVIIGGVAQGTPDLAFAFELMDNGGGPGPGPGDFETGPIAGVNVYRDGMLIAEMVTDTFYVDPAVDYGMYTYCVTYVYESGAESCSEACVDVVIPFPCDAPKDLAGEYLWTEEAWGSLIEWNGPQDAIAEWLFYDDGINVDGIGGPATFTWAIKFDPAQLAEFDGASLTKIEIYNRVAGSNELRIYEGTNAATLLHTQTLSGLGIETWEEVDLTSPVLLDVTKQLWIGVYTTNGAAYPAGCGNYVGNPNSDLITLDGSLWEHLNDLGLAYSWNLRGYVTTMAGATAAIPMEKPVDQISNTGASIAASGKPSYQTADPASSIARASRELTVFNVYRENAATDAYELIATVPFEEGATAYSYFDTDVAAQQGYNYQVTAFYSYANGTCESEPAMALVNPEDDFVYVFVTNTNELSLNNTRVYPNPATNNVVIESAQMNRVTVMSALGQVVLDRAIEGQMRHDLNTSTYEAGIYLIRIETNEGVVSKRLTIVR